MGAFNFSWLLGKPSSPTKGAGAKKKSQPFEIDYLDESFIQKLTDDIVEDVAFSLDIEGNNLGAFGKENPYRSKESRELLKYEMNIALRKLEREKKIHLGKGLEKGQSEHPLVPYLKSYLFEAVRNEIISPSS